MAKVGWVHQVGPAHAGNTVQCCHDMDLIYYWMGERPATAVQSVGALQHFTAAARPAETRSWRRLSCGLATFCQNTNIELSASVTFKMFF